MSPDDPRHGTVAGHVAHQRSGGDYCEPCIAAKAKYDKRRQLAMLTGNAYTVPSIGARRRIEALQYLGWSRQRIAEEAGWTSAGALRYVDRSDTMTRSTFDRIARAYERLSMTLPGTDGAKRARTWARRHGYAPPLAWDDIDDPLEQPRGLKSDRDQSSVDPVVVERLLSGVRTQSTRAEKVEALRRWLAAGGSEKSLCEMHGWRDGRYVVRGGEAA